MKISYPDPPLKEGQTYPGEITREEAARLTNSAQFRIPGLYAWFDYKPLLITYDELSLLDGMDDLPLTELDEHGLMPGTFSVTHCPDDIVYSCHEIEVWRRMLPGHLKRLRYLESLNVMRQ